MDDRRMDAESEHDADDDDALATSVLSLHVTRW